MAHELDANQVIKKVYNQDTEGLKVSLTGSLVSEAYDYIDITNTIISGQTVPLTVVYKNGGSGGTVVATLSLTYDGSANLLTVTRT